MKRLTKAIFIYLVLTLIALLLAVYARNPRGLFTIPINKGISALATDKSLFTTLNGELYEWSDVKIGGGGFVTGIVIHPKAADLVYARTDVGGLFRWNSTNQTWTQLLRGDNVPRDVSTSVESVAIAPNNPDIVYVATGAYTKKDDRLTPGTLLKSSDRGKTWQILVWKTNVAVSAADTQNIVWQPSNGKAPYFTKDGGTTWKQITFFGQKEIGSNIHTHLWNRQQAFEKPSLMTRMHLVVYQKTCAIL